MSSRVVILLVLCLGATAGVVGIAASERTAEEPLADAGLDQSVEQGTTVYLDAGGSIAPAGNLVDFEWRIEHPDGTMMAPTCRTCEQTNFQPMNTGIYNATVTVTDDQGRSASDTLRVRVYESAPPEVTLSGPKIVLVGGAPTINLTASAGDEPLSSLTWLVDGQQYSATFVDGAQITDSITLSAAEPGELVVEARVTDQQGRTATAEHVVQVENGKFGVEGGTLVTESGKYDLSSLAVEFTGSTSGLESTPKGDKWAREGDTLSYSIGLRTYEETTGETILDQPFTQRTAAFPHLSVDSDPHNYNWWGREPEGIREISMGPKGGTVEAESPVSSTSLAFWTTGMGETRIYGAQTQFKIRPKQNKGPDRQVDNSDWNDNNDISEDGNDGESSVCESDSGRACPSDALNRGINENNDNEGEALHDNSGRNSDAGRIVLRKY